METLETLFGSAAKLKVMRLFIFNPSGLYEAKLVRTKTRLSQQAVRRELKNLEKTKLLKKRIVRQGKKKVLTWTLNQMYPYLEPLEKLLTHGGPMTHQAMIKTIAKAGKIKLIIVSGIFTQYWDGRIDILIVGDKMKKNLAEKAINNIETEIGKDLHYALLDTTDFLYRKNIGDKLVRDVFDYPHEVVFDKIGVTK